MPKIKQLPRGLSPADTKYVNDIVEDYASDIKKSYGTMLMVKDVAAYMGCGRDTARKMLRLANIPYQTFGRAKRYRALDIARYLVSNNLGIPTLKGVTPCR